MVEDEFNTLQLIKQSLNNDVNNRRGLAILNYRKNVVVNDRYNCQHVEAREVENTQIIIRYDKNKIEFPDKFRYDDMNSTIYFQGVDYHKVVKPTLNIPDNRDDELFVYNLIHDQTINAFKSYKGNWVMNAFNSQRQEEVFNYISHKVNTIDRKKLKQVFEQIINEISQIDVKPYGG